MMEQKQQAAADPLTPQAGFQGRGSQLGNAEEPSSRPDPRVLFSLYTRFTYQGVGHQLRNPISDIWQMLKKM